MQLMYNVFCTSWVLFRNTKGVTHNASFTGKCMLTNFISNVVKRKSADGAKGQKGDIWHSRLSKMVLAHSLH